MQSVYALVKWILPILFLTLMSCENPPPEGTESSPEVSAGLPDRPNILWLVAEDLSPYLPSFGDSTVNTPTLSRLAAEGVCFDYFFASAPVCAPARASIATGMYPTHIAAGHMRTGGNPLYFPEGIIPYEAQPPAAAKMMSEYLRMEGYYCTNNAKEDYQFQKPVTAWDESSRNAHWRNRKDGQPFFAVFNFGVTHESQIWARAEDSLWVDEGLPVNVPPYLPDTEVGRKDVRRMYSNIKEMDHQVGEVIKQLEEDGLLENTIIFWYSDHGGPLPRQKRLLYDSGLEVPMIIRFPNEMNAGTRNEDMLSFIDLAPTVLSLTGITPPSHMDGIDFLGSHQPDTKKKYIHAAADRFDAAYDKNRCVRDRRYKYIRYYEPEKPMFLGVKYRDQMAIMQELYRLRDAGQLTPEQALWFRNSKPPIEFFDTETDPHELHNLANDPAYADKIKELGDECDRWLTDINDTGLPPEQVLLERLWPGQKQPETSNPNVHLEQGMVSIECPTPGASIGYQKSLADDTYATSWEIYEEPFNISPGEEVRVVAHRIGYVPSDTIMVK